MKICPNCKEEVENSFELCWNCNYSFVDERVLDIEDFKDTGGRELDCLRCHTSMLFTGNYKFHEGFPTGILGAIGEAFVNRETFDLYLCPKCGKVEFFSPL